MMGAIVGDVVGSVYEFNNHRSEDFPLFSDRSCFTDDTVLTLALAELFTKSANPLAVTETEIVAAFRRLWGKFSGVGYGFRFGQWVSADEPQPPYNSFGNGSAMRTAPCAWVASKLSQAMDLARRQAMVTHNHPEGIKAAEATTMAIFMARAGSDAATIRDRVTAHTGYDLTRTPDDIRPGYGFSEVAQLSVPEAIICALTGDSFEKVIRLAVSIGGDSDTIAAIAGSIAEARFGIPDDIIYQTYVRLTFFQHDIVDGFYDRFRGGLPAAATPNAQVESLLARAAAKSEAKRVQTQKKPWWLVF